MNIFNKELRAVIVNHFNRKYNIIQKIFFMEILKLLQKINIVSVKNK